MKKYDLIYDAEKIDELLESVNNKTIYPDASSEQHGLMSEGDKEKLDDIETISNIEIEILLNS